MANTTTTQIPAAVNDWYDRTLLSRAVPAFVHIRFGQVRDIPRNNSLVIKFRKYSSLTAATTALTEGVTPAGSQLATTDITATVLQYGDYVQITDLVDFSTLDPYLLETSKVLGEQAGNTLDQLGRNVINAGTTIQYASTATSTATVAAGMILNGTEIRKMVRTLQGNDARPITEQLDPSQGFNTSPIAASFIGIISPKAYYDLKNDPDFTPVREYGQPGAQMVDEVGALDEVRFVMSTNATVSAAGGSGGIDVHKTIILGKEAYAITRISGESLKTLTKPLGSGGSADPLDQRQTMGWKATFVAVRLQEAFMGRIEHAVSS